MDREQQRDVGEKTGNPGDSNGTLAKGKEGKYE